MTCTCHRKATDAISIWCEAQELQKDTGLRKEHMAHWQSKVGGPTPAFPFPRTVTFQGVKQPSSVSRNEFVFYPPQLALHWGRRLGRFLEISSGHQKMWITFAGPSYMATPPFFTTPKSSIRTPRHTSIGFPLAFLICPHGLPETKRQSPQTERGQGTDQW